MISAVATAANVAVLGRGPAWSPPQLGSSLFAWWDASRTDLITLSGSNVSSWRDVVSGLDAVQGTSGSRPAYSATSFNGRPAATFDGVDDYLRVAGVGTLPTGATGVEMWALGAQNALPGDATTRVAMAYGSATTTNQNRRIARAVISGVNRGRASTGLGASTVSSDNVSVDLSGNVLIRGFLSTTTIQCDVNGVAGPSSAAVSLTATGNITLGAQSITSPLNFWTGPINTVIATAPLTTDQAAQLTAYLESIGGIS